MDTTDAGMVPFLTGVTNIITAWLPSKWSRYFPAIPLLLGVVYGMVVRAAGSPEEAVAKSSVGAGSIALYSIIRNIFGTKPADAKTK